MAKLSITSSSAVLAVTLAPVVQAYPTAPEAQDYAQLATMTMGPQTQVADEACTMKLTPMLASLLGLPDLPAPDAADDAAAVACAK